MAITKKVSDFGEKIGGARKDFYSNALCMGDLAGMDDAEKQAYVKKDNVWPKDDAVACVSAGMEQGVAFWKNEVRKSVPAKCPPGVLPEDYVSVVGIVRDLVKAVNDREGVQCFYSRVKEQLMEDHDGRPCLVPAAAGILGKKFFLTARKSYSFFQVSASLALYGIPKEKQAEESLRMNTSVYEVGKNIFAEKDYGDRTVVITREPGVKRYYYPAKGEPGEDTNSWQTGLFAVVDRKNRKVLANTFHSQQDAEAFREAWILETAAAIKQEQDTTRKTRKQKFPITELGSLKRNGPDYHHGRHVTGDDFIAHFGIRGGEFGNWMDDTSSRKSLELCYDAFHDLARALGIHPLDISLEDGMALAVAFGARGSGNAAAHYEPLYKVINLTKYRGMGCLAHEWGHALDDYIGAKSSLPFMPGSGRYASESCQESKVPASFRAVMEAILYKDADPKHGHSSYVEGSMAFDSQYQKAGHGYWSSACELFARAFDCYVSDKMGQSGWTDDYLTSHADAYCSTVGGKKVYAIPCGEERDRITSAFDALFPDLIDRGWLRGHPDDISGYVPRMDTVPVLSMTPDGGPQVSLQEGDDGQVCFVF